MKQMAERERRGMQNNTSIQAAERNKTTEAGRRVCVWVRGGGKDGDKILQGQNMVQIHISIDPDDRIQ